MTDTNQTPRDADADLATLRNVCRVCDGDGSFGDSRPYRICTECGGTGRDEPTECLKIGEHWIERCRAAETRVMYCSFCRAEFPPDTSHDVLIQHSMTCEKSPVVLKNEFLKKRVANFLAMDLIAIDREVRLRDEIDGLRAELADLRSREVIEHDSTYFAPLAITNGTWEWFDASEGVCAYVGGESVPSELYIALPGVNLEKFVMAYPTREAAMQALRDAIETVKKEEEQP